VCRRFAVPIRARFRHVHAPAVDDWPLAGVGRGARRHDIFTRSPKRHQNGFFLSKPNVPSSRDFQRKRPVATNRESYLTTVDRCHRTGDGGNTLSARSLPNSTDSPTRSLPVLFCVFGSIALTSGMYPNDFSRTPCFGLTAAPLAPPTCRRLSPD
jgi:hypothetical protein